MISKQQYIEYLLNMPVNYTCSSLAEHLTGVSHDAVSDFLQRGRVTANRLWELVEPLLNNTEEAVLIIDDSVQNKQYSQQIGLVQRQYSAAEHAKGAPIRSTYEEQHDACRSRGSARFPNSPISLASRSAQRTREPESRVLATTRNDAHN